MNEELMAIEKNNTWQLTDLPKGHKPTDVKWVYKIKVKANGEIDRYKARLVAKGFEQRKGYDYEEIPSLVARMETMKLIIALAAQRQWKIHKMDVKSVFLNDPLDEAEYVAAAASVCQSIWLSNIMTQIGFNLDIPIKIYVDNVSAINLAKNSIFHQRSKHIDIRYHFLLDQVGKNMIKLEYCRSEDQIADILTKSLKIDVFIKLRDLLGMKVVPNQN